MKILLLGKNGQVGWELQRSLSLLGDLVACDFDSPGELKADFSQPESLAPLVRRERPDVIVNAAAHTAVDKAESEPELAQALNATAPGVLAREAATLGAWLVHYSTDYVFDGSGDAPRDEDAPTAPLSVYGRTKLAGELAVLAAQPEATVVRTSWVYTGGSGSDFVAAMRRVAATEDTVDVADDQIGSPTYVKDLAGALFEAGDARIREPVLHAANDGAVSRFQQARAVFEALGADPERVRRASAAQSPKPARRPVYSALSMTMSAQAGLTPLRPWRAALAEALAQPLAD